MKWLITILFLISGTLVNAQENLVQNPSFEEITNCPFRTVHKLFAPPWRNLGGGGGVLLHECGYSGYGIPENFVGGGYARTGLAEAGIRAWVNPDVLPGFPGNFVGIPFVSILKEDQRYNVEFYVSLYDSMWYAIKNIGIHFSEVQPPDDVDHLLDLVPQVKYEGSDFLNDKEGWMRIAGSFIAEGGEKFLTIGNFDGYDNTEVTFVGGSLVHPQFPLYWEGAYYYIDDVSVVEDTSYHVGIEGQWAMNNGQLSIFPNPAKTTLVIETENRANQSLTMYDATGREVLQKQLIGLRNEIDIATLPKGVYVAVLRQKGVAVGRKKVVVQ